MIEFIQTYSMSLCTLKELVGMCVVAMDYFQ